MATPFSEISKLMRNEMQKSDIFNKLDTYISLDILSDLIITGATVDFTTCNKDLELYEPYSDIEKNYTISSDSSIFNIDISQIEEKYRKSISLVVNDIEVYDFNFNIVDNNIEIKYDFKENDKIKIFFQCEGYFEENLKHREKFIIALSAYYHYLCGKEQEEDRWIKRLGDKDYSITRGDTKEAILKDKVSVRADLLKYIKDYNDHNMTVEDLM